MSFGFVNSALASATLFLIAIPIIIHLINRRRFRRMDWAAMEFLLTALKKNKRRVRFEQLLLLLLRIALMALIGLLLARPMLSDQGLEWLASAFRSEDKIFILDDSFSTSRREADRTTFRRELDALGSQVKRLAERGSGDRFAHFRASQHRSASTRGRIIDREKAAALASDIARLSPTDGRLPLAAALESVVEGAAREISEGSVRPKAVSILTDLRATDWTDGGDGPNEAVGQALERLAGSPENPTRISILDVGTPDTQNVAITDVSVEGGRPIVDIPADIRVEVTNFGPLAVRGLALRLRYAPTPADSGAHAATAVGPPIEELAPGTSIPLTVPCTFRTVGYYGMTVELTGARDPLPADNSCALAVEVVEGTEVLLVNGEPSSEPFEGETDFLERALAPTGEVASGIYPVVTTEENMPRQDLLRFSVIFLANLNLHDVPEGILPLLGRYVRDGGTLVIFLGDQLDDGALYNRLLGRAPGAPAAAGSTADSSSASPPEAGLLPARIGEHQAHEAALGIVPERDHPYFRLLDDAGDLVARIRFEQHFSLEPFPGAQVIARFSDPEGSPAMVEHAVEKGRVLLFSTAADFEWSDWPRSPAYLMMLQELVGVAARSRSQRTAHLAGYPVEIPVDLGLYSRTARLRTPGYPTRPELTLSASPAPEPTPGVGPSFRFVIQDTNQAGLYALQFKTRSGEEEWRQIAIRRDPAESNLTPVTEAQLERLYPDVELHVVKDAAGFSDVGRGRFEISDLLLWMLLAFLFLEGYLARRFAHHPSRQSSRASSRHSSLSPGGTP